jgi:hypothetical protein
LRRADHLDLLRYHHPHVFRRSFAPHFHADYQGQEALVGRIVEGEIKSATARKLIKQWAQLHRDELESNWLQASDQQA